jgi:hypothetical protein
MQNLTEQEVTNSSFYVKELLVLPEFVNILFLFAGAFGIYKGVEIQHPIYAVLFADMIVPIISSSINIISFPFTPVLMYVSSSNLSTVICLNFHSTCWCATSMIRYIYIVHENWLQRVLPNIQSQCFAAYVITVVSALCCTIPMFAYGRSLGEFFQSCV